MQKSNEQKIAEVRRLASIVRNELFSERDTLIEMDDYVAKIASAVSARGGGRMAVFLAYHMGLNTMSKKILELTASDDLKPLEFIVDSIPSVLEAEQTKDQ